MQSYTVRAKHDLFLFHLIQLKNYTLMAYYESGFIAIFKDTLVKQTKIFAYILDVIGHQIMINMNT